MLVLSRKDGEQILVGDDVIIKVLSIAGGRVRVGIEAPRNVPIRRSELTPSSDHFHATLDEEHECLLAGTVH